MEIISPVPLILSHCHYISQRTGIIGKPYLFYIRSIPLVCNFKAIATWICLIVVFGCCIKRRSPLVRLICTPVISLMICKSGGPSTTFRRTCNKKWCWSYLCIYGDALIHRWSCWWNKFNCGGRNQTHTRYINKKHNSLVWSRFHWLLIIMWSIIVSLLRLPSAWPGYLLYIIVNKYNRGGNSLTMFGIQGKRAGNGHCRHAS